MSRNVLNIAAGFLPIVAADFAQYDVGKVVNYDPLVHSPLTGVFAGILSEHPEILYRTRQAAVDADYANASVDLILAVSPFGFSLIDAWSNAKLKVGGYVVVFGAASNKWIKDAHLFTPANLKDGYAEVDVPEPWVLAIANQVAQDYPSHTSHLERGTNLERVRYLVKNA
jgi:hypothetical protein